MTRGVGLLAALCLIATACADTSTPPVVVEVVPAPTRGWYDEFPDGMIAIVLPTPGAEVALATPAAQPAFATSGSGSAAVTISQAASPPADEPTPKPVKTSTPKPSPPPAPRTPTPASTPAVVGNCPSTAQLDEGDRLVRAAQTLPAVFYGGGLCAGDRVEASIGGTVCGAATVNAAGQWSMTIRPSAPCAPTENATVTLTANGKAAGSATWKNGGLPPDVANGYALAR